MTRPTTVRYRISASPLQEAVDALAAALGYGRDLPAAVLDMTVAATGEETAEVSLAIPDERLLGGVWALAATVLEAPFDLARATGLRLLGITPGDALLEQAPGPAFGIGGTRNLAAVARRPLLGSIIKPSVGLSIEETADRVRLLGRAGLDFLKDDELLADQPHAPLAHRAAAVCSAVEEVAHDTGRRLMFAFNISSDDVERLLRGHDAVVGAGGSCVMVSLNQVGLGAILALRRHAEVPIHAHRNGWGFLARSARWGVDFAAYQVIWRLAGVDQLHVNGFANKFWEPDASVEASMRTCLSPLGDVEPVMPVVSSGQWGGQAPSQYAAVPTLDFIYLAGGGIQGHPDGPAAGVQAVTAAWEATTAGVPLEQRARDVPALSRAIERFGAANAG